MKTIMHIAQAPGGVERYLYTLLKKMDRKQFNNILVLSQDYDINKFKQFSDNIECVEMHREINIFSELNSMICVRRIIKKYRPDIVYMHSTKAGAIGRIANLGIKNISIYNPHGWAFNMKCNIFKRKLYAVIERLLAPLCTKIVAISDYEKSSAMNQHICKEGKIQVIYNGIDLDEQKEGHNYLSRESLAIPQNAFVVGMVGRLDKQKAPDVFVKAAYLIKQVIPNAFFIMVGNGTEQEEIEQMIKKYDLYNSFLITGWTQNPLDYIYNFDIGMLLSRWEGFGLVLAEYMLLGKPIIATRVDAIPSLITDGYNGLLIEVDDYKSAACKCEELFQNSCLQEQLINNGVATVYEKFDACRVAKEHEKLFLSI